MPIKAVDGDRGHGGRQEACLLTGIQGLGRESHQARLAAHFRFPMSKAFLRRIVALNGLGDDGAGGVAALVILTLGGDGPSHVAGRESQCDRCTRHDGRRESDDDFVDTLLVHIRSFFRWHSLRLH